MLKVIKSYTHYENPKGNLDERIRKAGVKTYKLAREGAINYPNFEVYYKEFEKRENKAKQKHSENDFMFFLEPVETYWYYLGNYLDDLNRITEYLENTITYKPQKKELKKANKQLNQRFEDYVNEFWHNIENYEDIKEEELELIKNKGYSALCEYSIKEFKKTVTVICRIIRENEIDQKEF